MSLRVNIYEYHSELFKSQIIGFGKVVLYKHLLNFSLRHFLSKFLHAIIDVFYCNYTTVISIKLLENRSKFVFCKESFDIDGSRQKFTPVNFTIAVVVDLCDHIIYLFITHFHRFFLENCSQF